MKTLRSFIPPLASMLMTATGGASAQGVLIDKSEIRFVSKQLGVNVEGQFRRWKANVDFCLKDLPQSKAMFEIDLASIDLASEESEAEVRRPSWFDTAKFPVAKFASTAVKELGGNRYEIVGTLTLKGVERGAVVPVVLRKDAAGHSVAEGEFTVMRLDFGVGDGMWADTDVIANEITVRVRMVLPSLR